MPSQTRRQAFCRPSRNVFALAALAIAVVGCGWEKTDSAPEVVERPFQGIELKLVIDADPGAAAAVRRMQGDWSGVTGAKLTIVETDDAAAIPADCDVVVGSPAYLARLAAQGRLRPILAGATCTKASGKAIAASERTSTDCRSACKRSSSMPDKTGSMS